MELQIKLKKNKNIVLRSPLTTKKVPSKMFRGFKVRKKVRLMFSRPKDSMKGKRSVLRSHKQRIKVLMVYLERKLQQYSYRWCIFK